MTSKEFVLWLKGFTEGVHEYNITPKQWDLLKEKLEEVDDNQTSPFPFGTPNTTPMWQEPHYPNPFHKPYVDPYNPFKVTCKGEETPTGTTITTTPGTGFITISNPNLTSFGSGSIYNVSTTTARFPISGSSVNYTNGGNDIKD